MYLSEKNKVYYNFVNKKSKKDILVFIHGFSANSNEWRFVINIFKKKNHPVIYLDLRGHGKSKKVEGHKLENLATDIKNILEKEKIKRKIILIGHSMGGMISLIFYKKFKSRVKKLVLVTTSYKSPFSDSLLKPVLKINRIIKTHLNFLTKGIKVKSHYVDQMNEFNAIPILKNIKIPTLIIAGSKDWIFPIRIAKEMHKYIKKSKLKILAGDHFLPVSMYRILSKEIGEFIK